MKTFNEVNLGNVHISLLGNKLLLPWHYIFLWIKLTTWLNHLLRHAAVVNKDLRIEIDALIYQKHIRKIGQNPISSLYDPQVQRLVKACTHRMNEDGHCEYRPKSTIADHELARRKNWPLLQWGTILLLSGSINNAGSELDPDFQTCHVSKKTGWLIDNVTS